MLIRRIFSIPPAVVFLSAAVFLTGCSAIVNSHRQKEPMMAAYMANNNAEVELQLNEKLDQNSWSSAVNTGDEIMWRLEAGFHNFHLGKFKNSIEQFKKAEELISEYDDRATVSVRDVGSEAGAALSNMNVLPYRGFCRDRIALSIFKSIAYLGIDQESAFRAQLRRLRDEQKKVQEDYKKFFDSEKAELDKAKAENQSVVQEKNPEMSAEQLAANPDNAAFAEGYKAMQEVAHKGYGNFLNPAAIFLSGLGSLRDGNVDNARIDFKRLYEAMPKNPMIQQYYVSLLHKTNRSIPLSLKKVRPFSFPLDRDCVYVLFANGRGAAFKQISIYFPIMTAWPVCEFYPASFQNLQATADNCHYVSMPLADMDGIIAQEFNERLPGIITRIILSTAIKEAAYYTALAAANQIADSTARAIAMISVAAAGTAYRIATNTADTRSWELLPKEFQLTQFPMPKNRDVSIRLEGTIPQKLSVKLPDNARSAIIFVSAPNEKNVKCHVFPLTGDGDAFHEAPAAEAGSAPSNRPEKMQIAPAAEQTPKVSSDRMEKIKAAARARVAKRMQAKKELDNIANTAFSALPPNERKSHALTKKIIGSAKKKDAASMLLLLQQLHKLDASNKNIPLIITAYGPVLSGRAVAAYRKKDYQLAVEEYTKVYPFLDDFHLLSLALCCRKVGKEADYKRFLNEAAAAGNPTAARYAANVNKK